MTWTPERVEALQALWKDGLSASQIAAELGGVTRNAVISKVHRLGVSERSKPAPGGRHVLWTPPRDAALRSMWRDGAPYTAIAARLGLGVNQVISRRQVLGLPPRPPGGQRTRRRSGPGETPPVPSANPPPPAAPLMLSIAGLTARSCRWPIGDPLEAGFGFCGHTARDGKPYCPYHAALAGAGFGGRS